MPFPFQGINIAAGFSNNSPTPLDPYGFVNTRQDLNLPDHPTAPGIFASYLRFIGRAVYVIDEKQTYRLKSGVTDADWEIDITAPPPILSIWENDTEYYEGQIVWWNGTLWRVNTTHTSSPSPATLEDDLDKWDSSSADTYSIDATLLPFSNIPAGTKLENLTFSEMMDMQVNPDVPPTVTFSALPAFGVRERGVAISSIDLSAAFVKTKYPISKVEFFEGATSLGLATVTVPAGETVQHTGLSLDGKTDMTYGVEVTDTNSLVTTKSGKFQFVNPMFIGSVPATVTPSTVTDTDVTGMTKRIALPNVTQSLAYTLTNEKFAIWVPNTWNAISRIMDPNSFNMTTSFTSTPLSIVNAAGETVAGRVWILNNPTTQSNFTVTFYF